MLGNPSYIVFGDQCAFSVKAILPEFRSTNGGMLVLDANKRGKFLFEWTPLNTTQTNTTNAPNPNTTTTTGSTPNTTGTPTSSSGFKKYRWDSTTRFALSVEEAGSLLARLERGDDRIDFVRQLGQITTNTDYPMNFHKTTGKKLEKVMRIEPLELLDMDMEEMKSDDDNKSTTSSDSDSGTSTTGSSDVNNTMTMSKEDNKSTNDSDSGTSDTDTETGSSSVRYYEDNKSITSSDSSDGGGGTSASTTETGTSVHNNNKKKNNGIRLMVDYVDAESGALVKFGQIPHPPSDPDQGVVRNVLCWLWSGLVDGITASSLSFCCGVRTVVLTKKFRVSLTLFSCCLFFFFLLLHSFSPHNHSFFSPHTHPPPTSPPKK